MWLCIRRFTNHQQSVLKPTHGFDIFASECDWFDICIFFYLQKIITDNYGWATNEWNWSKGVIAIVCAKVMTADSEMIMITPELKLRVFAQTANFECNFVRFLRLFPIWMSLISREILIYSCLFPTLYFLCVSMWFDDGRMAKSVNRKLLSSYH